MTDPAPRPRDPAEQRDDSDEAIDDGRRVSDRERSERRDLHDRTRQHARGGRQAHAGLDRERDLDDSSLAGERSLADRSRSQERGRADAASRRQASLLQATEDRLDDAREEENAAAFERRSTLRTASGELARLDAALAEIKARTQPSDAELTAEVEAAVTSAGRLGRALARALDAEDLRGDYHDVGGSG